MRADDLLVLAVADEQDLLPLIRVADGLRVDLGDERARRIDDLEPAFGGAGADRRAHAVRAEDDDLALGNVVDVLDEDNAEVAEAADDMRVVHDLVVNVDRLALFADVEKLLHHVDRHEDAGAEATGIGEHDPHDRIIAAPSTRGPTGAFHGRSRYDRTHDRESE